MSLLDKVEAIEAKVQDGSRQGLVDAGEVLLRAIHAELAPHRKSGRMESSLSVAVKDDRVTIVSDAPYAHYLDKKIGYVAAAAEKVRGRIPREIMKRIT